MNECPGPSVEEWRQIFAALSSGGFVNGIPATDAVFAGLRAGGMNADDAAELTRVLTLRDSPPRGTA